MEYKEQDGLFEQNDSLESREGSKEPTNDAETADSVAPDVIAMEEGMPVEEEPVPEAPESREEKRFSIHTLISLSCIIAAVSILLTFVFTNNANRFYYTQELERQNAILQNYRENGVNAPIEGIPDFSKLETLAQLFEYFSYYANEMSEEELITAVMKAYASATGDAYAEYYTEEEYEAIIAERDGYNVGIGVSVVQTTLNVQGIEYAVFQITSVYPNSPAASSDLCMGDCIYAVKTESGYQNVSKIGYTAALTIFGGEKGTPVEFAVFRKNGSDYDQLPFSIVRGDFETQSVSYALAENNADVAIVRITSFDLNTPHQLKTAVQALKNQGITKFIFDVRNNPGGDLQSIKAVLTYFLKKGDLILSSIDRDGNVAKSYYAEAMTFTGEYAACNVAESEIGMFADLDMVVLCNKNTASAAEVFTATLRDFGLASIVGETTFGKGIMQSFFPMAMFGNFTGYVKMTTYAYVTKCGVTYHEVGIVPSPELHVPLSEEAKQYNFYVLPEALDNQLQTAIAQFQ